MGHTQFRSLVVSLAILAGCNGQLLGGANLASLQFKSATPERLQQFAGTTNSSSGVAAPMGAPAPMAEGMVARAYPIWGGGMGNFTLVSSEEAQAAGMSGSFADVQSQLRSLLTSWAPDAKLSGAWGTDGGKPENGAVPSWNFSYWSPSRLESLNIYATAKETIIFKQLWRTLELNSNGIIDSAKVKALVLAAITDKNFVPPNEQRLEEGKALPPATDNQAVVAPPPPVEPVQPEETELFEVPENASWHYNLYLEDNRLVWTVGIENDSPVIMYAKPMTEPSAQESSGIPSDMPSTQPGFAPQPESYIAGGWARVDATTGEILSLTRPRRYSSTPMGYTEAGTVEATPVTSAPGQ